MTMITNTFIPHLVCNDFHALKKGISILDSQSDLVTTINLCDESVANAFKDYVINYVDFYAIKCFRQGRKELAYNLRYIKAMLSSNGASAHINGFVGNVSKKSLYEAVKTIEDYYLNSHLAA